MAEPLWCEEYRPKTIADCVLPDHLKNTFSEIVSSGKLPNILMSGTQGLGKTTVAKAICNELGIDYIMINSSEDNGIDILRSRIRQFASTISLAGSDKLKVVILDEADHLTANTQAALRSFIEEFSNNCRFILTCNFKNRLIEPLHSRCTCVEFNTNQKDRVTLSAKFHKRMTQILTEKSIKFDPKVLAELIMKHAPDWRRVINECQRHTLTGELSVASLIGSSDQSIASLMTHLKDKSFKEMRKWVATAPDIDSATLFRRIFDNAPEFMQPKSIPPLVLILGEYQYKAAFAADKELNMIACLTSIMMECQFK